MKKNPHPKSALFLLRTGVSFFSILPFRLVYLISDALYFFFFYLLKYRKKTVGENLENAFPQKQAAEIQLLTKKFYQHFCDILLESIKGLSLSESELRRHFVYKNPEIFTPLFEQGRSALLLGSHYGNWEWGVLSFPLAVQHKVVGIYKPLKDSAVNEWLNRRRRRWGLHLAGMNQAGRVVAQNRNQPCLFVLIADQTPSDIRNAHWLQFLNQDTPFLHGPDKLARQTGYPVFYFEIQRLKRGFYEVIFSEICNKPQAAAETEISRAFARCLEATIRTEPACWLWSHRRWKRKRPAP